MKWSTSKTTSPLVFKYTDSSSQHGSYLNVYVLLARILDEEGERFLPLWIDGCVTSLRARSKRIHIKELKDKSHKTSKCFFLYECNYIPCSLELCPEQTAAPWDWALYFPSSSNKYKFTDTYEYTLRHEKALICNQALNI